MGGEGSGRKPSVEKLLGIGQKIAPPAMDNLEQHLPNYSGIQQPAKVVGSPYKFPTTDGTSAQVMVTDGAGTLSWAAQTGGGGGDSYWTSGATRFYTTDQSKLISGSISGGSIWGTTISGTSVLSAGSAVLTAETNDLTAAVTWDNIPDANVPESAVTQHVAAIDHDSLLNYVADQHIDWKAASDDLETSGDISGGSIHIGADAVLTSYTENDPLYTSTSGSLPYVGIALSGGWNTDLTSGSSYWIDLLSGGSYYRDLISGGSYYIDLLSGSSHFVDTSDPHGALLTQTSLSGTNLWGSVISGASIRSTGTYSGGSIWGGVTSGTNIIATGVLSGGVLGSAISGTTVWASNIISGASIATTEDHTTSGSAKVVGIITHTSATPPTASNYPQGTLYIQYTA